LFIHLSCPFLIFEKSLKIFTLFLENYLIVSNAIHDNLHFFRGPEESDLSEAREVFWGLSTRRIFAYASMSRTRGRAVASLICAVADVT